MELRHLRYFTKVADELHFGRAADQLGISQPPLSQQIRTLEEELGVRLFARTSRRVQLTEAGRLFLDEARRTLAQADHAVSVARRSQLGELGELAIGFVTSAPLVPTIARALSEFRSACPAVRLDLSEMARDAQLAALEDGRIEAGFIRGPSRPVLPPSLVATQILEERLIVAMREDHPLSAAPALPRVADLCGQSFVLYDRELGAGCVEQVHEICAVAGFRPHVTQDARGLATLLGLVAAGFGISVIPESLGSLHVASLRYRPLDDPDAISRLWLVRRDKPSALCARFSAMALASADVAASES